MVDLRMPGEADPADDANAFRLGGDAGELDAVGSLVKLDAVEPGIKSKCHHERRSSPSVASCRPISSCFLTRRSISRSSTALSSLAEIAPAARFARASLAAAGRSRLPT